MPTIHNVTKESVNKPNGAVVSATKPSAKSREKLFAHRELSELELVTLREQINGCVARAENNGDMSKIERMFLCSVASLIDGATKIVVTSARDSSATD